MVFAFYLSDLGHCPPDWTDRELPTIERLDGRLVTLDRLDHTRDRDRIYSLYTASAEYGIPEPPPVDRESFEPWLMKKTAGGNNGNYVFYSLVDKMDEADTEKQAEHLVYASVNLRDGVANIGAFYWPGEKEKRKHAVEAFYLVAG